MPIEPKIDIMNEKKKFTFPFFQTTDKWAMPLRTKKCLAIHGLDSSWNDPGPLALKVRKNYFLPTSTVSPWIVHPKYPKKVKYVALCKVPYLYSTHIVIKKLAHYAIFPDFLHHARLPNTKNFEQTRTYRISHYSNVL